MKLASTFNRPTKQMKVICLSPLVKVFQPYANLQPFVEDPALMFAEPKEGEKLEVVIEGSTGTKRFEYGKIHLIDENDAYAWIGDPNGMRRTDHDYTGLVYFNVSPKISAALDYVAETGEKLSPAVDAELREAMKKFREASHLRVIEHCKKLYNTLMKSRARLKANNMTPEDPNTMELLVAFVLRDEIKREKQKKAALLSAFDEAASDIGGDAKELVG